MPKIKRTVAVPADEISRSIVLVRGQKVLLDSDLAALYGVTTTRLNQQVRRNRARFPADFLFELTSQEFRVLMLQNATSKPYHGGRRKLPLVFTEHGAIMVATILSSPHAVEMSVYVVRAFVQLRELLSSNKELARQFAQLESRLNKKLADHDDSIATILSAIRELMDSPIRKRRGIGFTAKI
jgi:ORF6N domain